MPKNPSWAGSRKTALSEGVKISINRLSEGGVLCHKTGPVQVEKYLGKRIIPSDQNPRPFVGNGTEIADSLMNTTSGSPTRANPE